MADLLAWTGAISGVVGGAAGVAALVYAQINKGVSEESRELARSSQQSSADAITLASESNRIAVDAKELAEEANTISLRAEARDVERNDVHWEVDWDESGTFTVTNTGRDEARRVHAVISIHDWQPATADHESVAGHGVITLEFPESAYQFRREVAQIQARRRRQAARRSDPIIGNSIPHFETPPAMEFVHAISYRITWETPLGRHCVEEDEYRLATLGDHERFV